ncbi:MAG TPA: hypothetical protein VF320_08705, partial [Acidimicrobiales bacterium]
AAFTHQEGMAPPTFASSGLLCSINVVPSSGCGQTVAGGYIYWSYFTGRTGSWAYASSGAFGTVTHGDVEGWRFQNPGTGRPNDPAPRTPPQYDSICSSGPGTTTTTAPATTKGGGHPHSSTHTHQAGAAPAPRNHASAGTKPTGTSSPTTTTTRSTTTTSTDPCNPTTTTSSPTTTTSSSTTTTSTAPCDPTTTVPDLTVPSDPVVHLADGRPTPAGPGSGTDSLIVGGLLVAALGIAAFARWRRRPRTP